MKVAERDWTVKNKHGVEGIEESTGAHYGRRMPDGTIKTYAPVFVPLVCLECCNYDPGETGDMGSKLSPPYCSRNIFFPIRTGTCKMQNRPLPKLEPLPRWPDPHTIPSPCPGGDRLIGRKRAHSHMPLMENTDQCRHCGAFVSVYRKRRRLYLALHSHRRYTRRPGAIGQLEAEIMGAMNPETAQYAYSEKHRLRGWNLAGWGEHRWQNGTEWADIYRRWLDSDQSEETAAKMLRHIERVADGRLWQWRAFQ